MLGSCAQPTRVGSCLFVPVTNHEGQSSDGVVFELHLNLDSKDTDPKEQDGNGAVW